MAAGGDFEERRAPEPAVQTGRGTKMRSVLDKARHGSFEMDVRESDGREGPTRSLRRGRKPKPADVTG